MFARWYEPVPNPRKHFFKTLSCHLFFKEHKLFYVHIQTNTCISGSMQATKYFTIYQIFKSVLILSDKLINRVTPSSTNQSLRRYRKRGHLIYPLSEVYFFNGFLGGGNKAT